MMPIPLPGLAEALVDQRHVGLIAVDRRGTVVESNARGREIVRREGGLRERNGRLGAQRSEDAGPLERILELALSSDAECGRAGLATVGAWPDQRPLTVYVNRVDSGRSGVAAIVVILDPWRRALLSPEQVAKSLGLTPAESRVAVSLAEGMTVREVAETTNRKPQSVRWLLQQALCKTWCSRQADLVRLVLASSHLSVANAGQTDLEDDRG